MRSIAYGICPSEVDDLVQTTFVKVWRSLDSFRADASLKNWIARIATNTAHDANRKRVRKGEQVELKEEQLTGEETPSKRISSAIQQCILELSEEHRTVLTLRVFEEFTQSETAEILSIPEGTVKSRLHHAKETLQKKLKKRGVQYES